MEHSPFDRNSSTTTVSFILCSETPLFTPLTSTIPNFILTSILLQSSNHPTYYILKRFRLTSLAVREASPRPFSGLIGMAWRCSGSSNSELIENLFDSGIIKDARVRDAMKGVGKAGYFVSKQQKKNALTDV
jgi:hypothetical protein